MSKSVPGNLWNEAGVLIRRCHQINQALFFEEVGEQGLTPVQVVALRFISERPGIDQRRLAAVCSLDEATLGGVVRRLVDRELIFRNPDPEDRRQKRLEPTPAGLEALRAVEPGLRRLQDRLLAPLDAEQAATLKVLLGRLAEAHDPIVATRYGGATQGKAAAARATIGPSSRRRS